MPIKNITLALTIGNAARIAKFQRSEENAILEGIYDRIPEIFNHNGLATKDVIVEGIESTNKDVYPLTVVQNAKTSHVLLLKGNKIYFRNGTPQAFDFNAQLIDMPTCKVVWTGQPYYTFDQKYKLEATNCRGSHSQYA